MGEDAPQAPVCRSILAFLDQRESYSAHGDGRPERFAPGLHLVVAAASIARTPDVALP
jgi:hypothetical protein